MKIVPITFKDACAFISEHHRHHLPPQGWKFGVAVAEGETVIGVACVGRPVSRHRDDGWTLEVTRLCTTGRKNAASKLYAACWRAARAMGYTRLGTYILATEPGTSLRAAGWREMYRTKGESWERPARPRVDKAPTTPKTLFEVCA